MTFKKRIIALVSALATCFVTSVSMLPVSAVNHTESTYYGYEVDLDTYKTPAWYNAITTNCYRDGYLIGTCTTSIGVTRAKQKASGGYYMDQVMVRCLMKGKNPTKKYAGYSEHLTIQSTLPSRTSLMAYSPTQLATATTYNVGFQASSDKTVGISASTDITKKALEINSYSDTNARLFKSCYDYQHSILRPNWKLDKYSYNESVQRAHYVIKTKSSKYSTSIVVKPKFQRYDAVPGYWANPYDSYTIVTHTIKLTTPY